MYIVIEIQKSNGQVSTVVNSYATINEAKNKYHTILAYASISSVEKHSAVILNDKGEMVVSECYRHPTTDVEVEN